MEIKTNKNQLVKFKELKYLSGFFDRAFHEVTMNTLAQCPNRYAENKRAPYLKVA